MATTKSNTASTTTPATPTVIPDMVSEFPSNRRELLLVVTFASRTPGAITLERFVAKTGANTGRPRWGSGGGQFGKYIAGITDLPTGGFIMSQVGKELVRHTLDFAFVAEDREPNQYTDDPINGVCAPTGDAEVHCSYRHVIDGQPDTVETLRLTGWVRPGRSPRGVPGLRVKLSLLGLAGTAKLSSSEAPAKVRPVVNGIELF